MKAGKDYIGVGCGALIINNLNQVLLLRRGPKSKNQVGFWNQPGGAVEFGETVEDAIRREIKEELDVEIKLLEMLCYTDHILPEENQHWLTVAYLAKIKSGKYKIMEPEKCDRLQWFDLNNLPKPLSETTVRTTDILKKKLIMS